ECFSPTRSTLLQLLKSRPSLEGQHHLGGVFRMLLYASSEPVKVVLQTIDYEQEGIRRRRAYDRAMLLERDSLEIARPIVTLAKPANQIVCLLMRCRNLGRCKDSPNCFDVEQRPRIRSLRIPKGVAYASEIVNVS